MNPSIPSVGDLLNPNAPKKTPCERCAAPSENEVWDRRLCGPCVVRWGCEAPAPSKFVREDLDAAIAAGRSRAYFDEIHQRDSKMYREWTAKWIAAAKRGAA